MLTNQPSNDDAHFFLKSQINLGNSLKTCEKAAAAALYVVKHTIKYFTVGIITTLVKKMAMQH